MHYWTLVQSIIVMTQTGEAIRQAALLTHGAAGHSRVELGVVFAHHLRVHLQMSAMTQLQLPNDYVLLMSIPMALVLLLLVR